MFSINSQVTSAIYVAVGYILANSIIIDTIESLMSAEKIREAFFNSLIDILKLSSNLITILTIPMN